MIWVADIYVDCHLLKIQRQKTIGKAKKLNNEKDKEDRAALWLSGNLAECLPSIRGFL